MIKGHKFIRKDESKTCYFCHGGRVYPEFTGDFGSNPDVHYTKGMMCMNCHNVDEMHGDGKAYKSRKDVKNKPSCIGCHPYKKEKSEKAKNAHDIHKDKLSCYSCHSGGDYRNCHDCHYGEGSFSKADFILGLSPRDLKTVTTLRVVPTIRDTFKKAGLKMESFDSLPNYWDSAVHNIKKRTDRTRSCDACHVEKKYFLSKDTLIKNGSKFNEKLIYKPKEIKK
ncbi:MAG: cytochrome c3 family protein [Proteobacteria bacterium]|nr:cytochrome c3 family protein [Pseudomonadota bacterium]